MLCQFTVKNFKSINDDLTLDMQATAISEHTDKIIEDTDGEKILPLAVIYGPNGSGKSNIIDALYSLVSKIMRPICATCDNKKCVYSLKRAPITPYKFSKETLEEPTHFELFFRTEQYEYKYNLNIRKDIVIYESLYKRNIDGVRPSLLFIRDISAETKVTLAGSFKKLNISNITESLPLISFLAITQKENIIVKDVIDWFEFGINILNYGNPYFEEKIPVVNMLQIKQLMLKMLKEMDIDIEDYRIETKEEDLEIYTSHCINNTLIELKLDEESSGTYKIFGILPMVIISIIYGGTLVIDELDAKLHPKLLKYIIELYRNPESNTKKAQLIFTSHDLSTMNSELFRRDEIWFVAKNNEQASNIYSLVEFKDTDGKSIRKDARFDKQYLEGKYGADPYLKRIINWEDIQESQEK